MKDSTAQRPLRIFVVENHADTLKYLALYLEQLGHAIQTAESMEDALRALPESRCDVLISDIGLPDGDGWELLRRAQLPEAVFTIAMTGFGMVSDREKCEAAGFRRHLLKPFAPEDLETILEEACGRRASCT